MVSSPGDDPTHACRLLQGVPAILAQIVLGALALTGLVYKRIHEKPQRPWIIWIMDVMKQLLSSLAAHVCGMIIAIVASHKATVSTSECAWYFVAFTFDTTLGVVITIALHRACLHVARVVNTRRSTPLPVLNALIECGYYGNPPSAWRWALQLSEWTLCVILARAVVGTMVVLLGRLLVSVAQVLDIVFKGRPNALLAFVMIVCPLLMNMAQLLVQDWVLRWRTPSSSMGPRGSQCVRSSDSVWRESMSENEGEVAELLPRHK